MNSYAIIMSIIYLLLFSLLMAVTARDKERRYYVKAKMLTSSAFVIMAFAFSVIGNDYSEPRPVLLAGLIACWSGDLALGYYHKLKRKSYILAGVGLFAVAHILFLVYLYDMNPVVTTVDIIVPLMAIPTILVLIHGFNLHMGHARIPIIVYSIFLTGFATKAVHMMLDFTSPYGFMTGFAGQLFWFSDYVLLFLYFYHAKNRSTKTILHIANLALYYAAMYLLALSVLY